MGEVLKFWFEELTPEDWFSGDEALDERIRQRFFELHEEIHADLPDIALNDGQAALAAIIVLDQFSRNLYRRQKQAFASDGLALDLAANAIERGFDQGMTDDEKMFLYMPYMHAEDLATQTRCVELFKTLDKPSSLEFAIEHCDIIARFGRFPHRNRVLERETTSEEADFLQTHQGYGQ